LFWVGDFVWRLLKTEEEKEKDKKERLGSFGVKRLKDSTITVLSKTEKVFSKKFLFLLELVCESDHLKTESCSNVSKVAVCFIWFWLILFELLIDFDSFVGREVFLLVRFFQIVVPFGESTYNYYYFLVFSILSLFY
jgi:hypothetical protein